MKKLRFTVSLLLLFCFILPTMQVSSQATGEEQNELVARRITELYSQRRFAEKLELEGLFFVASIRRNEILASARQIWPEDSWQVFDALSRADETRTLSLLRGDGAKQAIKMGTHVRRALSADDLRNMNQEIQEAMELADKLLGQDSFFYCHLENLHASLSQVLDRESAARYYKRNWERAKRLYDRNDPRINGSRAAFGRALVNTPECFVAASHILPAFAKSHAQRLREPHDPYVKAAYAGCADAVGALSLAIQEYDVGIRAYHVALDCQRKPNSQTGAAQLIRASRIYQVAGETEKAIELAARGISLAESTMGRQSEGYIEGSLLLASLYCEVGRASAANETLQEATTLLTNSDKDFGTMTDISVVTSKLLLARGDWEAAVPVLLKRLEVAERIVGKEHPRLLGILEDLTAAHEAAGNLVRAELLKERATEIEVRLGEWKRSTYSELKAKYPIEFVRGTTDP